MLARALRPLQPRVINLKMNEHFVTLIASFAHNSLLSLFTHQYSELSLGDAVH